MANVLRVTCRCFKGAGSSRGRRAAPWLHSRRARSLRTAARWRTTKPRARSGGGAGPSPPPPRPAGLSHSAAHWAAYTEAHQSTHTLQSGQERTHTRTQTHRKTIWVVILLKLGHQRRQDKGQKADLDLIQSAVITADYSGTQRQDIHTLPRGLPAGDRRRQSFPRWVDTLPGSVWAANKTPTQASYSPSQQEAAAVLSHSTSSGSF